MFPRLWEGPGGVDFVIDVKELVLTSRTEMFKAVYGEGIMAGVFSLHFVNGGFKFYDGEWYIGFM